MIDCDLELIPQLTKLIANHLISNDTCKISNKIILPCEEVYYFAINGFYVKSYIADEDGSELDRIARVDSDAFNATYSEAFMENDAYMTEYMDEFGILEEIMEKRRFYDANGGVHFITEIHF